VQEVYEFIKKCGIYYIATTDSDQPRVRPFRTINVFENKLYILTGKSKAVSKQMKKNPKIEICGVDGDRWIRVQAVAVEDDSIEAKQNILDNYPYLKSMYSATDGNMQILYLKDAVATISSFKDAPNVIKF
jgi:uncharacterized pyridoxamine 5'-phosphate oxidase family protein